MNAVLRHARRLERMTTAHLDEVADHALSVRWSDGIQNPLDESFEFLLDVLLSGITARVTKKRR